MAGTVRGKIDCLSSTGFNYNNAQEYFKNWYDFMEALVTAGVCQRIALQYGNGGTGVDFHDGANPFGANAFGVYRFVPNGGRTKDFYLLGQWSNGTDAFGASPGSPGLINGVGGSNGSKIAFSMASALASDGITNASPWNGDTGNDGGDTKGPVDTVESGPVWAAPGGGTLAVWPISNGDGNTHATDKQNCARMLSLTSVQNLNIRYGFLADDDNFFSYISYSDAGSAYWFWTGPITSRSGVSLKYPFSILQDTGSLVLGNSTLYGDTTGGSLRQSGYHHPTLNKMLRVGLSSMSDLLQSTSQPNDFLGGAREIWPLYLVDASNLAGQRGLIGQIDPFHKVIYGVSSQDTNTGLTKIFIGGATSTTTMSVVPWDGTTTPGVTATRGGVDF